ncbi:hypothetical protein CDL15_Pgr006199 [Punica granatum]|uniref:Uncharacterized protein n=1 Tax=Punica granatum TaxID=22663 RepID=A0A218XF57_PUNGR|nr:hypothetical protein CDL15_Pgr006199 [Punica granatum]
MPNFAGRQPTVFTIPLRLHVFQHVSWPVLCTSLNATKLVTRGRASTSLPARAESSAYVPRCARTTTTRSFMPSSNPASTNSPSSWLVCHLSLFCFKSDVPCNLY